MFTTTPFFRPRDGCEPRPTTSMLPSAPISPTRATTLEVPISSPTIRGLSLRLATSRSSRARAPADCEAIGIAQVHIGNLAGARRHHARRRPHEAFEALVHLLAPQSQRHAVVQCDLPCATLVEREADQPHSGFVQAWMDGQVAFG